MYLNPRMDKENFVHLTMEYYSAITKNDIMNIPESGSTYPEEHTWYLITYKGILAINYRTAMLQNTDPKELSNKENQRQDA